MSPKDPHVKAWSPVHGIIGQPVLILTPGMPRPPPPPTGPGLYKVTRLAAQGEVF